MINVELINNYSDKSNIINEAIYNGNNNIYVLSLDEKYGEPYIERLDINPLDTMKYLLENDDIFFVKIIKE